MTFGAPVAYLAKKVRYQWNATTMVFDKIVDTLGDAMLAGIVLGGTDAAPEFTNDTARVGKFLTIVQVATRHRDQIKIECDGKQGFWPRDTWTQATNVTFNTPGGATELALPLSVATTESVNRELQCLSHVSFVDICELEPDETRSFAITTANLEFDYEFIVFRMLPDGLNVDVRQPNRTYHLFTGSGAEWSILNVDDTPEWFETIQRWYRFASTSTSSLLVTLTTSAWGIGEIRSQFSHNMKFRFRRSNAVPLPTTTTTITVEVRASNGVDVLNSFSVDVLADGTIEERSMGIPVGVSDFSLWVSVPPQGRFEYQIFTERTYAP